MSNISIPLNPELAEMLNQYIVKNNVTSRADIVRKALYEFLENEAVMSVVRSEQEIKEGKIIRGDLKDILS